MLAGAFAIDGLLTSPHGSSRLEGAELGSVGKGLNAWRHSVMKIHSGHLTIIIIALALLVGAHLHKEDLIQLAQGPPAAQQEEVVATNTDLQPVPTFEVDDNTFVSRHSTQCIWPDFVPEPTVRELVQVDGTIKQVTEPVWRQTIQPPRAIEAIEIVDTSGNRWRLISGKAQKGEQLAGRITREDGQTYFIDEQGATRWLLVTTTP